MKYNFLGIVDVNIHAREYNEQLQIDKQSFIM